MHRPRRTSEFHEEPSTASKRQSRLPTRFGMPSPGPGTAQKYSARKSRLPSANNREASIDKGPTPQKFSTSQSRATTAAQSRESSLERGATPQLYLTRQSRLTVPTRESSFNRGYTPQKTPLTKQNPNRALFTAEKQRGAAVGASMHNDKKWVQEQTQLITEYLQKVTTERPGIIPGIGPEFFTSRSGGLKHMSIKQFVSIINYFLYFIWGSRYKVGLNHVEDIVNFLHKLQYPYQVNKSWLKTPNAQHSFGNVIVILNFLMAFAPKEGEEPGAIFPLQDQEATMTVTSTSTQLQYLMPDTEFQALLISHAEEGFSLWDQKLDDEWESLQKLTCDSLIKKRCNVESYDVMNEEIEQMKQILYDLEQRRPVISREEEEQCEVLQEKARSINKERTAKGGEIDITKRNIKQLKEKQQSSLELVAQLEAEIAKKQKMIKSQSHSAQERDKLKEQVAELKHDLQSQERTVSNLQELHLQQQVQLSRSKRELTDEIEKFNAQMHGITYSDFCPNAENLQLPLNPSLEEVKSVIKRLQKLRKEAAQKIQQQKHAVQEWEKRSNAIAQENSLLEPKIPTLEYAVDMARKSLQDYEKQCKEQHLELELKWQQLVTREQQLQQESTELSRLKAEQEVEIGKRKEENERIMREAELRHAESLERREEELKEMEECVEVMKEGNERISELLEQNQKEIESVRKSQTKAEESLVDGNFY